MGKKQHQKDKLYLTNTEWRSSYGGYKKKVGEDSEFRRLPFDCCSLSLRNFEGYPVTSRLKTCDFRLRLKSVLLSDIISFRLQDTYIYHS